MIIGINGKIGSGKDTVGKIIQYLLCNNTGGIELEDITSSNDHDWWLEEQSGFDNKKFAGKLKAMGSLLTGIPVEKFEDQDFKKTNLGPEWSYELVGEDWVDGKPVTVPMTVRVLLQKLGTEAMRDGLHTNVWVNALFADYKAIKRVPEKRMSIMPNWIITDMRFPNEMDAVKEREGITIRVNRPTYKNPKEVTVEYIETINHPSETALDDSTFDYEIVNNGTIKELAEKVQIILIKEGIL